MTKYRARIVCSGVAAELDLRASGRRDMLGAVFGRIRREWFSGTSAIVAHLTRSNPNVQRPRRWPVNQRARARDPDCARKSCAKIDVKKLRIIAPLAVKTISRYFGGHVGA